MSSPGDVVTVDSLGATGTKRRPAVVVLFALFFAGLGCLLAVRLSSNDSQPWVGPIPKEGPIEPDDPARHLPVTFTIKERAGVARPDGLIEAGVPFAAGAVGQRLELRVSDDGRALPASFAPLAWWPDGSVRWAKMTLPVRLAAGETKHYVLAKGEGPALVVAPPEMPDMMLRLVTARRTVMFPVKSSGRITRGQYAAGIDVEVLTQRRLRIRVQAIQLGADDVWKSLSLEVASGGTASAERALGAVGDQTWSATIRHAQQRGPKDVEARDGKLVLHLYPPSAPDHPADQGFHVTHEIVLERGATPAELAGRVAAPLRAAWPPGYFHATRAMGRTGVADEKSRGLDDSFVESWKRIRAQQTLSRNRGWTVWGDFFDRAHGGAYSGFLNQEYDPATAFFIYHARTGDPEALDTALDMARQYADNCVSLRGGCYQHRATLHALQGQIAKTLGARIRRAWRRRPEVPATDAEVVSYVGEHYGDNAARGAVRLQQGLSQANPAVREKKLSAQLACGLIRDASERANDDRALLARLRAKYGKDFESEPLFRELAEYSLNSPEIESFGLPSLDEVFAPFFARYGGSWKDFPAFHFHDLPVEKLTHAGGHSLAEMLVWGHLMGGDPSLRRAALQVAHYHVAGGLVDRSIRHVEGELAAGRLTFAREVGWPLVNLLALEVLTERAEPELDAKVKKAIRALVACILSVPPDAYQSTIHVGVVSEGLARYHQRTGDPQVREYLIRLARYWAATQWNARRQAFHYIKDQSEPAWPDLSAFYLYGLTYAAWQSGDQRLTERARQVLATAGENHPGYVKSFAMKFHNSQRAVALLPLLSANP